MNALSALFVLFVTELFAIAAVWHDMSSRSGMERESKRPDPAVLFSSLKISKQKATEQYQSAPTIHSPQLPLILEPVRRRVQDVYFSHDYVWGIAAK